jgi:hypothetical protein
MTTTQGLTKPFILGLSILVVLVSVINIQQNQIDKNASQLVSAHLTAVSKEHSYRIKQLNLQEQNVFDVCNDSRISKDISENNCGTLQDNYDMEFICKQNNNSVNNLCWVEYKGNNWTKEV